MAQKISAVKIKYKNGTYSSQIPFALKAENVFFDKVPLSSYLENFKNETKEIIDTIGMKVNSNCVTPEMFGAKGDGEADDTAAIQNAINNSNNILFGNQKTYKTGKIIINTSNTTLDFNNSNIICTEDTFLECVNDFNNLLYTGEYVANTNYGITELNNYQGLVSIDSVINVMPGRVYYYGGCVTKCNKGILSTSLPYSLSTCNIYGQTNNISNIIIKNIASITGGHSLNKGLIQFSGISDVIFENVRFTSEQYIGISLKKCTNIFINYCIINVQTKQYFDNNTYGICIQDGCSYTTVENSEFYSDTWHCITTGGQHTNIHTKINNSIIKNLPGSNYAYLDHGNTIDTVITNCTISESVLITDGIVSNCNFLNISSSNKKPTIGFSGWLGNYYHSKYIIKNCKTKFSNLSFIICHDLGQVNAPPASQIIEQIDLISISDCFASQDLSFFMASPTIASRYADYLTDFSIKTVLLNNIINLNYYLGNYTEESYITNCQIKSILHSYPKYTEIFSKTSTIRLINCKLMSNFPANIYINNLYMDNCSIEATGNKRFYVTDKCLINNCYFNANFDYTKAVTSCEYNLSSLNTNNDTSNRVVDFYKAANTTLGYRRSAPFADWYSYQTTPI